MKWQKFSEVVKQGMDETGNQGFTWQGAAYAGLACCDFVEYMGSWGGSYFGAFENLFGPINDRPVTVDEEPVINAIKMMRTFIYGSSDSEALDGYASISPEEVVSYKEESSRTPFTNGNVIAHRNWPYAININGASDAFGEDLGVMPIPYHTSAEESKYGPKIGGTTSAMGGWHLTLNPNAPEEKLKAAVQMFKVLQKDQVRLDLFEIGGWTPPIEGLINTSETQELDIIGRYVNTLELAGKNAVPRPVTPVWPSQSTQVAKEVNATLRQQKSPSDAMSTLKSSLESIEEQGA
jgi:ABC-type glycerol-3-phosphate transport system substrate-binding protein